MFLRQVKITDDDKPESGLEANLEHILQLARCSGLITARQVDSHHLNGLGLTMRKANIQQSGSMASTRLRGA